MIATKHTFCRICEPQCPMLAEIGSDGKVTALIPDLDHPSTGVACHKGLSFLDVHNDPDRLFKPRVRTNPRPEALGTFVDVDWDRAISEIGQRTAAVRERHGPNSVAFYLGNPAAFNAAGIMMAAGFQAALGTQMRFSATTQDSGNRLDATAAIYGPAEALMVPDLLNTAYLLCLGANPKVSHWTGASLPNNWDIVKDIGRRGGKVRFVNSRVTESSTADTGPTVLIKPGTDVYFLAALLNEIYRLRGFADIVARYGKNVATLLEFVRPYTPDSIARVTGIDAELTRTIALEIIEAPSAAVYLSTGVNQSRQGLLAAWLAEMINFVTGNLGRPGGVFKPAAWVDHFASLGEGLPVPTSIGTFSMPEAVGHSVLPAALLPELIESGDIKALFVLCGNPLLSVGGGEKAIRAYQKLELLVSIDIYPNATAEMADFVLPAADWIERADINLLASGGQLIPYVQYTEALEKPAGERKHDWWILARLAQAIGVPSPLDQEIAGDPIEAAINAVLGARGVTAAELAAMPSQSMFYGDNDHASLFRRCLTHEDGRIDCCPQKFADAGLLGRCADIFAELEVESADILKMISLRTPHIHNSWLANVTRFRRGKNMENPLHMTQFDADRLGLIAGDAVTVSTSFGTLESHLLIDNDLCRGTVAMSHGFGHERSFGLRVANRNPGANCNALMPTGGGSYEPLSYMSWLSGVPVDVRLSAEGKGLATARQAGNAI